MQIPFSIYPRAEIYPAPQNVVVADESRSLIDFVARLVADVVRLVEARPEFRVYFADWFRD